MTFARGLNIDFARKFRDVLPNVLRNTMGVPRDEGTAFARNLDASQMQGVVHLLLTGGMKQFGNLAYY